MEETHKKNEPEEWVTSVSQLRLKRTIIADPAIVRLYLKKDLLFQLHTIAHFAGLTVDELIRDVLKSYVKECNGHD